MLMELAIFRPLRDHSPTVMLVTTFAISFVLQSVALIVDLRDNQIGEPAGSVLGVALGALTLLVIQNGLTLVRVDPLWLDGMYGLVILLAVGLDTFVGRRADQLRTRR